MLRIAAFAILLLPMNAFAHRLDVTAMVEPAGIRVVATFEDDAAADGATVILIDADGKELARGVTDARGECQLPRPEAGFYTLMVQADGHKVTLMLPVADGPVTVQSERPNRWLMTAVGLAVIGCGVWGMRRWLRQRVYMQNDGAAYNMSDL